MKRVSGWTMMAILAWVLACALSALPDDDAGQRVWHAGRPEREPGQWQAAQAPGHIEAQGVKQDSGESQRWRRLAANRGEVLVATAGPPPKAIREAQELLAKLGYAPGPADGVWGQSTVRAYRAFLRDQGRPVSDTLTPQALRVMRRLVERRGGVVSPRETPRQQSEPRPARRETVTFADGGRYKGEVRDGKAHGRGTMTYANGDRYEGEFRNGKRHGWGIDILASGHRYEGNWRNDRPSGREGL